MQHCEIFLISGGGALKVNVLPDVRYLRVGFEKVDECTVRVCLDQYCTVRVAKDRVPIKILI